jgi:hypothetical protein
VAAAGGPAAWPWYFIWGLVFVAAVRAGQRSRALVVAIALAAFLVKPNGVLAVPLGAAPVVLIIYLGIAGVAWNRWRRRAAGVDPAHPEPALRDNGTPPALART